MTPQPQPSPRPTFTGLLRKHRRLTALIAVAVLLLLATSLALVFAEDWGVAGLFRRENLDQLKEWILDWGVAAPLVLIGLHVLQILIAPIPGQSIGIAGGYIFGWDWGILYTMIGQAIGTLLVLGLARWLGRPFVHRFNSAEAVADFERLLFPPDKARRQAYQRSKQAVGNHGLVTFFVIMLLPALPDDLVCFVAGLSRYPIWKLLTVALLGRFPGMLMLCLVGDGFSESEGMTAMLVSVGAFSLVTVLFLWQRKRIEGWMMKLVQRSSRS